MTAISPTAPRYSGIEPPPFEAQSEHEGSGRAGESSSPAPVVEHPLLAVSIAPIVEQSFEVLYTDHVDMVWRGLRGLGVSEANIEDAVQDVFLVVHRRLASFEARSSFKTWLFGIVVRVARNHRRQSQRKGARESFEAAADVADSAPSPDDEAATAQAFRDLVRVLSKLDEPKRELLVLAELEQLSAPEIAETLGLNLNTVYSRLRHARSAFDAAAVRDAASTSAANKKRRGRP